MTVVVKAESPTKRFGEVSAVTDLAFALEAGTITGFLGPNGAGKTTTLRMILGLAAPSSGRALVFGRPYAELPRAALRIGAVLEATDFHPGRSGRDHLRMLGKAAGVPDSRADQVLRVVELSRGTQHGQLPSLRADRRQCTPRSGQVWLRRVARMVLFPGCRAACASAAHAGISSLAFGRFRRVRHSSGVPARSRNGAR
jgi:energy-coupling factor transporter ATP-binding protein EcfA2